MDDSKKSVNAEDISDKLARIAGVKPIDLYLDNEVVELIHCLLEEVSNGINQDCNVDVKKVCSDSFINENGPKPALVHLMNKQKILKKIKKNMHNMCCNVDNFSANALVNLFCGSWIRVQATKKMKVYM